MTLGSGDSYAEAVASLRDAWVRTASWPADRRKTVIGICLAYRLRGLTHAQAQEKAEVIRRMVSGESVELPVPDVSVHPEQPASVTTAVDVQLLERLIVVIDLLGGTPTEGASVEGIVAELERSARSLVDEICRLGDNKRFMNVPVNQVIQSLDVRLRFGDDASRQAAQEMFDRLLKSVDPVAAKEYVEEKGLRFGPFHKAALYDAVCEKYAQMSEYHEKGRLVRDFRAMYRSRLSELAKSEGAVES